MIPNNRISQFLLTISLLTVPALPLAAQTTADTGTCSVAPLTIKSFVMEYARGLTDLKSTLQASVPADLINSVLSGKNDVHDRITYDAATNQFVSRVMLVPHNSPSPTPANSPLIESSTFLYIFVNIDRVMTTCSPYAAVMMVGTIREGVPLLGNPKGAPYMFSFGYKVGTSNPARLFRDIMSASSGLGNAYHDYGAGSIALGGLPPQ